MQLVLNELVTEIVKEVVLGIRTDRAKPKFRTATRHATHQAVDADHGVEITLTGELNLPVFNTLFKV